LRINSDSGISGAPDAEPVGTRAAANASAASRPLQVSNDGDGDETQLSPDAMQLSTLSNALANVPQIRQGRVATISQAIRSGTYAVSNQQVAQSMLRDFRTSAAG